MKQAIWILLAVGLLPGVAPTADADLVAGDVSVLGYRVSSPQAISFVTWVDLSAGALLHFTDSGFFSDGTMRDFEDVMSWTAPAGGLAAGTVVVITSPSAGSSTADVGTSTGSLHRLTASGDQVFIGTTAFPTAGSVGAGKPAYPGVLLHGLDWNNDDPSEWAANATTNNTSALPAGLGAANLNVALDFEVNNGQYTGVRSGLSVAAFKALVDNKLEWTQTTDVMALSSVDFTIVAVPEASAWAFGALACGAAGAAAFWRRRGRVAARGTHWRERRDG